MGGGAGISFESNREYLKIILNVEKENINTFIDTNIDRFKMLGYEDGLDNIRIDLLKSSVNVSNLDINKIETLLGKKIKSILLEGKIEINDMIGAGFICVQSSGIKNIETEIDIDLIQIELLNEFNNDDTNKVIELLYYNNDNQVLFNYIVKNTEVYFNPSGEEFENCFNDVFNFNMPDDINEDEQEEYIDSLYGDIKSTYCVSVY